MTDLPTRIAAFQQYVTDAGLHEGDPLSRPYHDRMLIEADAIIRDLSEWRPIKSAPRDGRYIVLFIPNARHPLVGHYFPVDVGNNQWWVANTMHVHPTHWLPLPPKPETDE